MRSVGSKSSLKGLYILLWNSPTSWFFSWETCIYCFYITRGYESEVCLYDSLYFLFIVLSFCISNLTNLDLLTLQFSLVKGLSFLPIFSKNQFFISLIPCNSCRSFICICFVDFSPKFVYSDSFSWLLTRLCLELLSIIVKDILLSHLK